MEQTSSETNHSAPISNERRKPSNTVSWLGFSFSLFVLVLLWLTLIVSAVIITNSHDTYSGGASAIFMIFLLIGIPLGLAGLVLSIIGLIKASNRGGKKWIGTCGLVFTGLSILSVFAPVIGALSVKDPATVTTPTSVENTNQHDNDVVFIVDDDRLKCFDNRETKDANPYETQLVYSEQIKKELDVWFTMHNIPKDEPIKVQVSHDTDYTQVSELLEALDRLEVKKYKLMTELNDTTH